MTQLKRTSASSSKMKRRNKSSSSHSQASGSKPRQRLAPNELKWKTVNTPSFSGIDGGGGMMMLEELDDVDIEWEEAENGRKVARFVAKEETSRKGQGKGKGKGKATVELEAPTSEIGDKGDDVKDDEEGIVDEDALDEEAEEQEEDDAFPDFAALAQEDIDEEDEEADQAGEVEEEPAFDDALLPEWKDVALHTSLKKAFLAAGYVRPTDIQKRAIPAGLNGRDVVGVAETGSGKTLAYSLPILSHLLRSPLPTSSKKRPLSGLVLCPTRELALQVVDHLNALLKHALTASEEEGESSDKLKAKSPPRVSIGSVVGGLSAQKQKRILERGCDILVATPGRLWDLIKANDELASSIRTLRFLVIDEADRMIENGHFAELENIVKLTQRSGAASQGPDDDDPVFAQLSTLLEDSEARDDMQTFVFSATLSKDLQQNLKRRLHRASKGKGKRSSTLEDLVDKLDFRDPKPEVIDLSPEGGVVSTLRESMVECVVADKDLYLYYFLLRYPGRSIVFIGSVDGIRRLIPLFTLLQLPIFPLHSQLQQKQRLKNLDRFKSTKNGILIATDVAARGLDIPQVDHVIHFNLPRTADAYIHRSGRTARAKNEGFALQLCSPEEKGVQRALMKSLGRSHELPELPIETDFLPPLRERLKLAREIELAEHSQTKSTHDKNWLKEAAEAMDLDIDPDMFSDAEEDDKDLPYSRTIKQKKGMKKAVDIRGLRNQLRELLSEKLIARGISAKYPTSGSKVIIDDLLKQTGHATLLGAGTKKAYDEVQGSKRKLGSKSRAGMVNKKKKTSN
ncbi:uncharacterized protein I303_100905 [Kwoniella dejecticola CBS 10117]|uniref:ATP-dependent RNA helicase n=1 Tax=Kwoniella dejecticola CBS 10117 TaxID=1296121 RepID=A0A1A6AG88_9TREE|nr:ATP-dependent RNA helicase MAK5 [Kwoniella dejecticola CBS 10117]OBR89087.1 ATP-dependent RNA helicase MAK5 [Kwoniella dejecticola CBS 10117]